MTAVLLGICQLAALTSLNVRGDGPIQKLAVTHEHGLAAVSLDAGLRATGATLRNLPSGRFVLELPGTQIELAHATPFVRVGDRVIPLAGAPRLTGRDKTLPLQLLVEVVPRFSPGMSYDARSATLNLRPAGAANAAAARGADEPRSQPRPPSTARATQSSDGPAPARRRIIVDAGHGGPDEGTSAVWQGKRYVEKDIALSVARLLAAELRKKGFDVLETRTRDTLIALHDRGAIANKAEGSLFISVHVNAAGPGNGRNSVRGVETYFLAAAKTEDAKRVEALENSSLRFEGKAPADAADPLSFILADMLQNSHLRESSDMAAGIQSALSGSHPGGNRGVKQAGFAVLVGSFMPAVLVELGFLTNQQDAAYLTAKTNQQKIAGTIAAAVESYFQNHDTRVNASGKGK